MEDSATCINSCSFNQTRDLLVVGHDEGFSVFRTHPYELLFTRVLGAGIGLAQLYFSSNILALVGGGKKYPLYPLNRLIVWDDSQVKIVGEVNCCEEIKAVRLQQERLAIGLESRVLLFRFMDLLLLDVVETYPGPRCLMCLARKGDQVILATPSKAEGCISVTFYGPHLNNTLSLGAHQNALSAMEVSFNGSKLASASESGTIIKVFDLASGELLQELRRGSEQVLITSLFFSESGRWLGLTSNSGTLHVFGVRGSKNEGQFMEVKNTRSKLAFMSYFSDYFDSEWSFARCKVDGACKGVFLRGEDSAMLLVGEEGKFISRVRFDAARGGDCQLQFQSSLFVQNLIE